MDETSPAGSVEPTSDHHDASPTLNLEAPRPTDAPVLDGEVLPPTVDPDLGFSSELLLTGIFPYRRSDRHIVTRQSGPYEVTISSSYGLPYGKYPRLMMVYIISEANKRKHLKDSEARRIPLSASMNTFFAELGIAARSTGGQNGSIRQLREQLGRITTTTITMERLFGPESTKRSIKNLGVVDSLEFWVTRDEDQLTLMEPYIELSSRFYAHITERPIPVDLNVLKRLSKPRAIDIYMWATARKFSLTSRSYTLPWSQVQAQFGPDTPDTARARADFRKDVRKAVGEVNRAWPGAGLLPTGEGLVLPPGEPSIPRRYKAKGQQLD